MRAISFSLLALFMVAACSSNSGPAPEFGAVEPNSNDFVVTPADPLVIPNTLTLPTPTQGGVNRADRSPATR